VVSYNFIAIEGNIGAGKTSLAKMIAKDKNAKLILERFKDNSFLPKFYKEPEQYAFPLEMSFLADRYQQLKDDLSQIELFSAFILADYFIDKSLIFSRKTLKPDEYALYSRLFNIITSSLPKPELLIYLYLKPEHLKANILKRARHYERDIELSYLDNIQKSYFEHFKTLKSTRVVIIDTTQIDFVNRQEDYQKILSVVFREYPIGITRINLP
jgi:deoxyadenosine/deoxycytidine kinase